MAGNEQPSRVLLLRNLARGATDLDVEALVHPFTRNVKPKIYLQPSNGRAFVEFVDVDAATAALQYFQQHPIQLKNTPVNFTYSTHSNVTTLEEKSDSYKILLVSVTNVIYPVNMDLIHYLFKPYGVIHKIVTFSKAPSMYQALIQFAEAEQAKDAMLNLHNRNIYNGCNTLQIQPSHLKELVIKANHLESRDYSMENDHPYLNRMDQSMRGENASVERFSQGGPSVDGSIPDVSQTISMYDRLPREIRELNLESLNRYQTPVLICYNLPESCDVDKLFNLFSQYGTVFRIKILRDKAGTALIQYSDPIYASIAKGLLKDANIMGNVVQIRFSRNLEVKMPSTDLAGQPGDLNRNKEFPSRDQRYRVDDIQKYARGARKPTHTLFVAKLDANATEEELSKVFEVYGTVRKVKFKEPVEGAQTKLAIVAMQDEIEASTALMNLHNTPIRYRHIKVAFSKTNIL